MSPDPTDDRTVVERRSSVDSWFWTRPTTLLAMDPDRVPQTPQSVLVAPFSVEIGVLTRIRKR